MNRSAAVPAISFYDAPSVCIGITTGRPNSRRVRVVARIANPRSIAVARLVAIGAQAGSVRICSVAIVRQIRVRIVVISRLIGVALVGIARLVAIVAVAGAPIWAAPVTGVIG